MEKTFNLEIVTPEKKFFSDDVEMVIVKTIDGEIGILPDHVPMVVAIDVGYIKIKVGNRWDVAIITEGFMEITKGKTILLTDAAEWPDEIDENRAKAAKTRAEERLTRQLSKVEYVNSRAALARAMARLQIKQTSNYM